MLVGIYSGWNFDQDVSFERQRATLYLDIGFSKTILLYGKRYVKSIFGDTCTPINLMIL